MTELQASPPCPADEEALRHYLREAAAIGQPCFPIGRGSRLARSFATLPPLAAGFSLAKLDAVRELDVADQTCEVEAGISPATLAATLAPHGLEFGVMAPGAAAGSLGGLCASHELNLLHGYYGPLRDQVLGLRLLLPDGTPLDLGAHVVKSVAGYDLTRLVLGSQGRLGVITRLTLRLRPRPQALAWCRLKRAAWAPLRQHMPTPRHAFALSASDPLWLAWPQPLPAQCQQWEAVSATAGEAALASFLAQAGDAKARRLFTSWPTSPPKGLFAADSLQAVGEWASPAEASTAETLSLPPSTPDPLWEQLREALCPGNGHFGPEACLPS